MVSEVKGACTGPLRDGVPTSLNDEVESQAKRTRWLVILAYTVCCLVWSTTYFVVRQTVSPSVGNAPYFNGVARFGMAVAIFIPVWLIFARKDRAPSRKEIIWVSIAGILNGLSQVCVYGSEQEISGGLAAVLAATTPLMVALLAVVTRTESVSGRTIFGFIACFFGVALVCHDRLQVSQGQAWATLLMLACSFFNASANVTLKRTSTQLNPIKSATIFLAVSTLPIWAASLLRGEPQFAPIPTVPLLGIVYLAVMSSFVAFSFYLYMLKHVKLMTISTLPFVIPVLALVVDMFLEKSFSLNTESWIGCFVVMAGVIYSVMRR